MSVDRPVMRYYGGKFVLAPWIISNFPIHKVYVEPFGGAASVLMQKARSYAEVYNDLDGEIVNVFRVLQNPTTAADLSGRIFATPFSRAEYDLSHTPTEDPVESARRVIIRSFMGFGADSVTGKHKSGFRADNNRAGTTPAVDWKNYHASLAQFADRLRGVVIECRPYDSIVERFDREDTLFYFDPPYVHATRQGGSKHGYRHEMTDADHRAFLEAMTRLKGMAVISGYESDIYDQLGWQKVLKKALADGAGRRTEALWLSPSAVAHHQGFLNL